MQRAPRVLIGLAVLCVTVAACSDLTDEPQADKPVENVAELPPHDLTTLSAKELATFNRSQAQFRRLEARPGLIAVGSPHGPLGYIKTSDLAWSVAGPNGVPVQMTLYDENGEPIGIWDGSADHAGQVVSFGG